MVRGFGMSTPAAWCALIAAAFSLAACGSADVDGAPSTPPVVTDSPMPTTTPRPTSTGSEPTSEPASEVDVAAVEAAVYADIAARSADSSARYYPGTLDCGSGRVPVGSALACSYIPDEPVEFGGPFVVVLDEETIAWTSAPCCDAAPLPEAYPSGALCRDLAAPPPDAPREVSHVRTLDPSPDYHLSYALAVWYWYAEGRPTRMDADLDGIPCETVYEPGEVTGFWDSTIALG